MCLVGEMTLLVTVNLFYLYNNLDRNCISLCTAVVIFLYTAVMLIYLAKLNLGYVY